jgi:hypothetical protein
MKSLAPIVRAPAATNTWPSPASADEAFPWKLALSLSRLRLIAKDSLSRFFTLIQAGTVRRAGPCTAANSLLTDSRSLFARLGLFLLVFHDGSGRLSGMAHDD